MKRINNLFERIISIENLMVADQKARKGKAKTYGVRYHDRNREANIQTLHESLRNKTFRTSAYDTFTVYEPKEREIFRLPYYPDRIVHHAIMNVLEPIWTKVFTHNTYSCIKGRGIEGCARRVSRIIRSYQGKALYCLKLDIVKFYPSIDHKIAKRIIRKKIKDNDLLWLLDEIIDSVEGLPIGNYLSQFIANLYLAYFMHFVNERLHKVIGKAEPFDAVEYADDIVLFADNKAELHEALNVIQLYLSTELRLTVKGNHQIFPVAVNRYDKHGRALDYVGYKFFRRQKLIRKSIKQNFCRHAARANRCRYITLTTYKQHICSWLGWAKHSNSRHLLKKIIKKEYYESILRQQALRVGGSR